ncbi:MAG: hypothetical protein K2X52_16860 [Mycobacteriaceae bacterium]|nr:hypothetical protein [Mycobacteriaceae bacterium]
MSGPRRWVMGAGGGTLAIACAVTGVGMAYAQPAPIDPVVPQIPGVVTSIVTADGPLPASPPPPPGAPTVPAIPADMRQQPGGLGSLDDVRANFSDPNSIVTNLFPDPAVPYTPVRQMPMGPPPPPDPAFAPPA